MQKMMVVTIHADDVDDLRSQLVKFAGQYGLQLTGAGEVSAAQTELPFTKSNSTDTPTPVESEAAPAPAKRGPKPKKSKEDAPADAEKPSTAQTEAAPPVAAPTSAPPVAANQPKAPIENMTAEDISEETKARNALAGVVAAFGKDGIVTAREVVTKFKKADGTVCQKFSELDAKDYPDFVKACAEKKATAPKAS